MIDSVNKHNDSSFEIKNIDFGISIQKPNSWYALNSTELENVLSRNISEADTSVETTHLTPLFQFVKYPMNDKKVKYDPNILGTVFSITNLEEIKDECDIFVGINVGMEESGWKIPSQSDCRKIHINGKTFTLQNRTLISDKIPTIKQTYYIKINNNGYLLSFLLSYIDESDNIELENIIHTLQLKT